MPNKTNLHIPEEDTAACRMKYQDLVNVLSLIIQKYGSEIETEKKEAA